MHSTRENASSKVLTWNLYRLLHRIVSTSPSRSTASTPQIVFTNTHKTVHPSSTASPVSRTTYHGPQTQESVPKRSPQQPIKHQRLLDRLTPRTILPPIQANRAHISRESNMGFPNLLQSTARRPFRSQQPDTQTASGQSARRNGSLRYVSRCAS